MQSSLSKLLFKEHDIILEAGETVRSMRHLWQENPLVYAQKMDQLAGFFSAYADEYHHHKEEEILFPALCRKNETAGESIVGEMLEQHEDFRARMLQIRTALELKDYNAAQEFFENYINALQDHIAVENDELFPMADALFSDAELERFYHHCLDKDAELGLEKKEKLEMLIHQFNMI